VTTGLLELQVVQRSSQIITNKPTSSTGRMPFLSPNQQCQSTEGKSPNSSLINDKNLNDLLHHIEQNFSVPKLIVGDFNFGNIDTYQVTGIGASAKCVALSDNEVAFVNSLREYLLFQHVVNPTRQRGTDTPHILDLVITSDNFVSENKF